MRCLDDIGNNAIPALISEPELIIGFRISGLRELAEERDGLDKISLLEFTVRLVAQGRLIPAQNT